MVDLKSFYVIISKPLPPVAQLVEHLPFKQRVAGSSPAGRTLDTIEGESLNNK